MATLQLEGIEKSYESGRRVLAGIDLEVSDGEFLVLVGPSGCGKSTLLRIVAGLVEQTAGQVRIDGRAVDELEPGARDVAMVFQNYALYPHMTVAKNLAFPLRMARRPKAEIDARVREVAGILGLEELLARKPGQLSGGQMQRVAVGRAIVREPRLFLFDEPLSNLDAQLRATMRQELAALHRRLGVTTLYVTHDQAEAMTLGDRVAVLDGGELLQVAPPLELFEEPATRFVGSFIGSPPMNQVLGRVTNGRFEAGPLRVACPLDHEGPLWLGLRPHQLGFGDDFELAVDSVEALGAQTLIRFELDGATDGLRLSCEGHHAARRGERVGLAFDPRAAHWFDPTSGVRLEPAGGAS